MRRRGSYSANMLKPTVAVVQGGQRQEQSGASIRRTSEPSFRGMNNGGFATNQQPPQASAGHAQNVPSAAAQPQNNMQWQHGLGQQANTRHHSFASSMDLISHTASTSIANRNVTAQPLHDNLFKSSSHHTSHTVAAGDLLTMSRRALDPPPPNQSNFITKKRSATKADATGDSNTGQSNDSMSINGSGSNSTRGQHFMNNSNPQKPIMHAPQHKVLDQMGGAFPNNQATSFLTRPASTNSISSSTLGTMGEKEESYQEHRTIRQCRRSNSFEMMEDG
mmetsp:Transcript_13464/g.29242  ORF Transcript_13464/g.29242 Transcript_13464/m.29242 type:complete len:278 (+) Transcript_13464:178-1011(+)